MSSPVDSSQAICVFCASHSGHDPIFKAIARTFGRLIAESGMTLVYGGGRVGLMGELANAALQAGGRVVGVIPQGLMDREAGHPGLHDLEVVTTLSQRKQRMSDLAQAFVALPGGIGTLDELFEVWTWGQLGLHRKPCGLLNVCGYFNGLVSFLDQAVDAGFLRPEHRQLLCVHSDPAAMLELIRNQE